MPWPGVTALRIRPFVVCDDSAVDRGRWLVGADRTVAVAVAGAFTWAETGSGSAVSAGHSLCPASRHCLATAALGAGIRIRSDLLAAPGPLAEGRGPSSSCTVSCSPRSTRPAHSTGLARAWTAPTCARKRGSRNRSVTGRPAEDGQQTPPDLRRTRSPAPRHHDRRQPQRHHSGAPLGRRHRARRRATRLTATAARVCSGRQGVRLEDCAA